MKRIISLILVGGFLHLAAVQAGAQSNDPPAQPKVLWAIVACLAVVAVGVTVTIYVYNKYDTTGPVTVILEKSYNNGDWTPILTNSVVLNGRRPIELFQDRMDDGLALYRARIQR